MSDCLLLVHVDSLASYQFWYGCDATYMLVGDLARAIVDNHSMTFVLTQDWHADMMSEFGIQCRNHLLHLARQRDAIVLHHDEMSDIKPWSLGIERIVHVLRLYGVQNVRLGGLWTSHDGRTGCVHAMQRHLTRRGFSCTIDRSICAFEEYDNRWLACKRDEEKAMTGRISLRTQNDIKNYARDNFRDDVPLTRLTTEERVHREMYQFAREHSAYETRRYADNLAHFNFKRSPTRAGIFAWYFAHIIPDEN